MQQRSTLSRTLVRAMAVVVAMTVFLTVTATDASAESAVSTLQQVASNNGDMNSGATEWSGATFNPHANVIMTLDDEVNAYEFPLVNGSIDPNGPVRVLTLDFDGTSDYEGIAWMSGNRYAILSEGTGVAYIVDVPEYRDVLTMDDVAWQFNAGGPDGNSGSEGIAVGPDGSFYVTDEMPASVSKYTAAGSFVGEVLLPEIGDASGVAAAHDDSLVVISHESRKAIHVEIDWATGDHTVMDEIWLGNFSQLEGVAIVGNEELHFFGELKGGQTYSHMVGQIVADTVDMLDVNCSGDVDIVDALFITLVEVGNTEAMAECGTGDSNGDGRTNVIDALLIAQCEVGIPNQACTDL